MLDKTWSFITAFRAWLNTWRSWTGDLFKKLSKNTFCSLLSRVTEPLQWLYQIIFVKSQSTCFPQSYSSTTISHILHVCKMTSDMCILCSVYFLGIDRLLFLLLCLILQVHMLYLHANINMNLQSCWLMIFFSTFRVHTMCINCCLSLKKCYM